MKNKPTVRVVMLRGEKGPKGEGVYNDTELRQRIETVAGENATQYNALEITKADKSELRLVSTRVDNIIDSANYQLVKFTYVVPTSDFSWEDLEFGTMHDSEAMFSTEFVMSYEGSPIQNYDVVEIGYKLYDSENETTSDLITGLEYEKLSSGRIRVNAHHVYPNGKNPNNYTATIYATLSVGGLMDIDERVELTDIRIGVDGTTFGSAGTAVREQIKETMDHNAADALGSVPRKSGSKTASGVTFEWHEDRSITITGTASAATYEDIYAAQSGFPDGIAPGRKYHLDYHAESVSFAVYPYVNGTLGSALIDTLSEMDFEIPTEATGIIMRYRIRKGKTANETVKAAILPLPAASNKMLGRNTDSLRETLAKIMESCDTTINLLDPQEITEGYVLSNNVPVAMENYYYSDYIKIGMLPFCHSQAGSVSEQIHCYDADKNFIGSIAVDRNFGHYEARNGDQDANLRYVYIKPLDGTVYIRVNGSMTRPKMVTPLFSPLEYGASAQNLAYGEIFRKHGLKIAMFGDSITLGRDGNSSAILEKNIPYYVSEITHNPVDNYGVGSMGWVSTAYLAQIAYDKISSVDLTPYDVITLCYGVNDTQAPIGAWNTNDETTVCGQIHKCIKYIAAQNHKAKIILIAPFNTCGNGEFPGWRYPYDDTAQGWSRQMLSDKEKQIAEYYYIDFISQKDSPYNGFGFGMPDGTKTHVYCGQDDVHPTAEGYKALGHWLAAKIMQCIR